MRHRGLAWCSAGAGVACGVYWACVSPMSQLLGSFPNRGGQADRVVALTFDDGPNEPYTSQIGDLLAGQHICATFFQVGRCTERHPATASRLIGQGHVIGNHSYSHRLARCIRPAAQRHETRRTQDLLAAAIGRRPALYRPPWLLRTPWLMTALRTSGLQPVSGVFCHPWEAFQPGAHRIARRALAKTRPGTILILHDGSDSRGGDRTQTVGAVELVVAELKSRVTASSPWTSCCGLRPTRTEPDPVETGHWHRPLHVGTQLQHGTSNSWGAVTTESESSTT